METNFLGKGEVRGFEFSLIKESPRGFIYKKEKDGDVSYEVFERKVNKRWGNVSYPSSRSFGTWAWDYRKLEDAISKFEKL